MLVPASSGRAAFLHRCFSFFLVTSFDLWVVLCFFFYCSPRTSWLVTTQKKRNEREGKKKDNDLFPPPLSDVGHNEISSKSDANHDLENRAKKRKRKVAHCLQPKKKGGEVEHQRKGPLTITAGLHPHVIARWKARELSTLHLLSYLGVGYYVRPTTRS